MIPAKMDPISISAIRENSVESVVTWFDQHKQSLYTLGFYYLRTQQQMEELFYRTISKVHKELPRFKNETSFEMWVTSIFIHICRELSDDSRLPVSVQSEPRLEIFQALDQMREYEKDAVALTYIKGISQEETAHLLQVSVEKLKAHLFSGIQSLRKAMGHGSTFIGCKEYQKDYIGYFERTMERSQKIEFEKHIYHCQDCQEDLASFQDVMLTLSSLTDRLENFHVPSQFMENIQARLAEEEKQRQQKMKKRRRIGIVFTSVLALLIGIEVITGSFSKLYYTWTEEDQELRAYLKQDLGERLNLAAESNGVKIKIKSAIADEVQTLIFYEIEDTNENNQYMMNYQDGVYVENEHKIMSTAGFPRYYPPDLGSDVNKKKKNVYQGKMSLLPLSTDSGTIKLQINRLQKLIRDSSNQNASYPSEKTGEWNFEIPVKKQPSIQYALDEETEIEGIPVRFNKLSIAPTATILQYALNVEQSAKRIDALNFEHLIINNKRVKAERYGSNFVDSQLDMNWFAFQTYFEPIVGETPKEVQIRFQSAQLSVEDHKTIELDASKVYPQTFEYAGSTISIDKVEVGDPTSVVISNHEVENREFESLNFNILGQGDNETNSMDMNVEGVVVDKNGVKYDMNKHPVAYEEIEHPRYFFTVQRMELHSNNIQEEVIPKSLEIYGYSTTKYLDDVVKISLE
jgi:RNA polymerase sigma factor (sigma-70 family)